MGTHTRYKQSNMASSLNILSKIVSSKVDGMFKSEEEDKEPPSEKELKEEEKRKLAIKQAELDRKKQHIDDEYQREKKRQEIRDKYGIAKLNLLKTNRKFSLR